MRGSALEDYLQRELHCQVRRKVSGEIRKRCPEGEPMVSDITVMLGTVLAMAMFTALLKGHGTGRRR